MCGDADIVAIGLGSSQRLVVFVHTRSFDEPFWRLCPILRPLPDDVESSEGILRRDARTELMIRVDLFCQSADGVRMRVAFYDRKCITAFEPRSPRHRVNPVRQILFCLKWQMQFFLQLARRVSEGDKHISVETAFG